MLAVVLGSQGWPTLLCPTSISILLGHSRSARPLCASACKYVCHLQRTRFLTTFRFWIGQPKSSNLVKHLLHQILVAPCQQAHARIVHRICDDHDCDFSTRVSWPSCSKSCDAGVLDKCVNDQKLRKTKKTLKNTIETNIENSRTSYKKI